MLESYADELLQKQKDLPVIAGQTNTQVYLGDRTRSARSDRTDEPDEPSSTYEKMILQGRRYLCQIPRVEAEDNNSTAETGDIDKAEKQKELARATDRGLELLREMEGECLYYVSGWWSYSFCYNRQVRQFHARPSGNGIPTFPPTEDPETQSFVLGRFSKGNQHSIGKDAAHKRSPTRSAELQTKGASRYLVQRLDSGSVCDLTGRSRRIEVQFHCHPQTTDRIGWIKELTTCSYLMVIYTPRLCNDVAFLPPQQDEVNPIECREILSPREIPEWETVREHRLAQELVNSATPEYPVVGGMAVGAQRLVGTEGRQIDKGLVASVGDGKLVAKHENGAFERLPQDELKELGLAAEEIEAVKKKLEDMTEGKDWILEVVDLDGERGLQYLVDPGEEEGNDARAEEEAAEKNQNQQRLGHEQQREQQRQQKQRREEHELQRRQEELSESIRAARESAETSAMAATEQGEPRRQQDSQEGKEEQPRENNQGQGSSEEPERGSQEVFKDEL